MIESPRPKARCCKLCLCAEEQHWHLPPVDCTHIRTAQRTVKLAMGERPYSYKNAMLYASLCRRELAEIGVHLVVENHMH